MRYFYVERMIKKSEFSKEYDMSSVPLKKIRILQNKAISSQRKCIVEHPFGTVKHDMGVRQLLLRGIRKAEGELSLAFLAFNETCSEYHRDKEFDGSLEMRIVVFSTREGVAPATMPDIFLREHKNWGLGAPQTVVF